MDKNLQAVKIFDKLASLYEQKYMNVELYKKGLTFLCANTKNNASVLELACGPGNITKYVLHHRSDVKILATDLSENMIALATKNNPNATFEIMDCRHINQLNQDFDVIICGFVFPYLSKSETEKLVEDMRNRLNKNGLLYISTIEGNYNDSMYTKGSTGDEIFMHFYEEEYLSGLLGKNNFLVLNKEKVLTKPAGETVTDIVYIAQKKN